MVRSLLFNLSGRLKSKLGFYVIVSDLGHLIPQLVWRLALRLLVRWCWSVEFVVEE